MPRRGRQELLQQHRRSDRHRDMHRLGVKPNRVPPRAVMYAYHPVILTPEAGEILGEVKQAWDDHAKKNGYGSISGDGEYAHRMYRPEGLRTTVVKKGDSQWVLSRYENSVTWGEVRDARTKAIRQIGRLGISEPIPLGLSQLVPVGDGERHRRVRKQTPSYEVAMNSCHTDEGVPTVNSIRGQLMNAQANLASRDPNKNGLAATLLPHIAVMCIEKSEDQPPGIVSEYISIGNDAIGDRVIPVELGRLVVEVQPAA